MSALVLKRLEKSFGGLRVTAALDLTVEQGERRLIIGPNGAGKTTLFNLITGELRPDAGAIALFPGETLLHTVTLSLLGLSALRWNPFRRLARQQALIERARAALGRVGLDGLAERPLAQTSYGERRRVEIAMALAQEPRLLLLDEPFAGLSIDERKEVHRLLLSIPRDVTVVMIEHDMDVALELAERITLMHFGEVIVEGTRAEVVAHPRTREIYLGA
jgi:branched-chain amino acid transport system ATP-binding protein